MSPNGHNDVVTPTRNNYTSEFPSPERRNKAIAGTCDKWELTQRHAWREGAHCGDGSAGVHPLPPRSHENGAGPFFAPSTRGTGMTGGGVAGGVWEHHSD